MGDAFDDPDVGRLFSQEERRWLRRHGSALEALIRRRRDPTTAAQHKFLDVVEGRAEPTTDAERLWLRLQFARESVAQREHCAILEKTLAERSDSDAVHLASLLGTELLASLHQRVLLSRCAALYLRRPSYDPEQALAFARISAELGDGPAANLIGLIKEYGIGCLPNREEAVSWYKIAAERGVKEADAKARSVVVPNPSARPVIGNGIHFTPVRGSGYDSGERDNLSTEHWEHLLGGPDDSHFED